MRPHRPKAKGQIGPRPLLAALGSFSYKLNVNCARYKALNAKHRPTSEGQLQHADITQTSFT